MQLSPIFRAAKWIVRYDPVYYDGAMYPNCFILR